MEIGSWHHLLSSNMCGSSLLHWFPLQPVCHFCVLSFFFFFGVCVGLLCWVFVVVWGFSRCGTWALWLWHAGSAVLWHIGSQFSSQGSNPHPCVGRWILNHCTTREVPSSTSYEYIPLFQSFVNLLHPPQGSSLPLPIQLELNPSGFVFIPSSAIKSS